MVILKKLRSATLVEAIVATAIIVIIFIVASLILNNLLLNAYAKNSHSVEERMDELIYMAANNKITLPYTEAVNSWDVKLTKDQTSTVQFEITAIAVKNKYSVKKHKICTGQN